jgi:lipopolysaccharide biosynthesis glycosyltransferase
VSTFDKRVALVTQLNDDFIIGFKVMVNSLLKNNPWFDLPIIILDDGLTDQGKEVIKSRYKNIIFQPIDKARYEGTNFSITAPKLRCTYYKLDIFNIKDYDRLVFIDSDVVILRDIKELFSCVASFAAVKGYDAIHDIMRRDINSGVFVFNKESIDKQAYVEMLRIARSGHKMPDQATINMYFKNHITYLEKTFNVEKRMQTTRNFRQILNLAKIVHYVGEKPWQIKTNIREEQYFAIERRWNDYNY